MKKILRCFWQGVCQGFWEGIAFAVAIWAMALPLMGTMFAIFVAITGLGDFIFGKDHGLIAWLYFIGLEMAMVALWLICNCICNYTIPYGTKILKGQA